MKLTCSILLASVAALAAQPGEAGRWVGDGTAKRYVLNPAANEPFLIRCSDLAVTKYYREPLARAEIRDAAANQAMTVLRTGHRAIQRLVLDSLWKFSDSDAAARSAESAARMAAVKREFATMDAELAKLLGQDGFTAFCRALARCEIERQISANDYAAKDLEAVRTLLATHLLDSGGLPLADQSAGLKAMSEAAATLSPEARETFLRRWSPTGFPFSLSRPLVVIPGTSTQVDPSRIK